MLVAVSKWLLHEIPANQAFPKQRKGYTDYMIQNGCLQVFFFYPNVWPGCITLSLFTLYPLRDAVTLSQMRFLLVMGVAEELWQQFFPWLNTYTATIQNCSFFERHLYMPTIPASTLIYSCNQRVGAWVSGIFKVMHSDILKFFKCSRSS